jgi:hypothetical protein
MSPAADDNDSGVKVHQFNLELDFAAGTTLVHVQSVRFGANCTQIWLGDGDAKCDDIVLAIKDRTNPKRVNATKVFGPLVSAAGGAGVDDVSENFATKLSSKLSKAVYFSYGCSNTDALFVTAVQKALFAHLNKNKEHF